MSFETFEDSRYKGEPVDIYLFRWGPGANDYFAYTDAETKLVVDGITYLPIPIRRSSINASGTLDKAAIEVRTPTNVDLADKYRLFPPSQVVSLVIRQGHIGDPDNQFLAIWSGRVLGSKRERNEASYTCDPISTALRRSGLRRHWQYSCPHVLYGPMCRASKSARTITATVNSVSKAVVTLNDGWQVEANKILYAGGLFEWDVSGGFKETRTIWKVDSNVLVLSGPASVSFGQTVYLAAGCNKTMDHCNDVHHNLPNFGGQPWIPKENPIGIKNNFY